MSASTLLRYDREIYQTIGKTIESNYRIKEKVVNLGDESINKLVRYFMPFSTTISASMVLKELYGVGNPLVRRLMKPLWHLI